MYGNRNPMVMQPGMQGNMQQQNAMSGMQGSMGQMQTGQNPINQAFTPDMLQQFKAQIVAYKLLSRNQQLPENIAVSAIGKRGAQGGFQGSAQGPSPGLPAPQQMGQRREPTPKANQSKPVNAPTAGMFNPKFNLSNLI